MLTPVLGIVADIRTSGVQVVSIKYYIFNVTCKFILKDVTLSPIPTDVCV